MGETVATRYAVRVMGVWIRRADAFADFCRMTFPTESAR